MDNGMHPDKMRRYIERLEHEVALLKTGRPSGLGAYSLPQAGHGEEDANPGKFRAIFENSPLAIMCTDHNGTITMCNDRACEIFGAPRERLIGFSYKQIRDPRMRESIITAMSGRKSHFEGEYLTVTGSVLRKMSANFSPSYTSDDTISGVIGIFEDISGRMQIEEELRLSQKRLEAVKEVGALATSSPDLDVILERVLGGTIKAAGASVGMIFLLDRHLGRLRWGAAKGLSEQFLREYETRLINLGEGLTGQIAQSGESIYIRENASSDPRIARAIITEEKLNSFIGVPIFANDTVIGVMNILSREPDILGEQEIPLIAAIGAHVGSAIQNAHTFKQLQKTERNLQDEQRFLETLIHSLNDTLFVFDHEDGRPLRWNRTFREISGYSDEEIATRHAPDSYHPPEERDRLKKAMATVLQKGAAVLEAPLLTKDGRSIPFEFYAAALNNPQDGRSCIISIGRDLRERKKIEEELIRVHKLESLGVLAGGIAHDFNNLLTAILGNISLAKLQAPDEKILPNLLSAEKASRRARDLTQQLLTFSKGGMPIVETARIGNIIKDAAEFVLHGSKSACDFSIPEDLWLTEVDPSQISQVFHNLLLNATQAMPAGGRVEIEADNQHLDNDAASSLPPGRYVHIAVRDHGCGMPPAVCGRIFDPYFTTKPNGNGLGLATSYSIIKKHNGLITVDSTPGSGTIFHLFLPAAPEQCLPDSERSEDSLLSLDKKILVMEDQEEVREILTLMLQQLSCEVAAAGDGKEAVAIYRKARQEGWRFDAVILDLTIPGGMGGKETVAELRAIDPEVVAVVSSGYSQDPIMAEYQRHGFQGCVSKPYSICKLANTLHAILSTTARKS